MKTAMIGWLGAAAAAGADAAQLKLADWVENATLSGDMRIRHEDFEKKTPGQVDRSRQRFRLRLAAEFTLPNSVKAKLRLASGTGEQQSTNQSFDNLSSQKSLWIDRAYVTWNPRPFAELSAGKMKNPLWRTYSSDAVWDDDFNPEGFGQSFEFLLPSETRLFANGLQLMADEDSGTNNDQWTFSQQAGVDVMLGDVRVRAAAAYHRWQFATAGSYGHTAPNEGNRRAGATAANPPGVLANEFGVGEWTTELGLWAGPLPVSIQGTYLKNFLHRAALTPKEDIGYQVGARLGKASAPGTWEAAYFFKWVETDATVADVADSDFGDGGTNRRGHIGWIGYSFNPSMSMKAKYFITRTINESLAPNADDIDRLQLDLQVKF